MKTKLTLEFDNTEEDKRFAKFISYNTEISSALFQITIKTQRKPTHFSRWMNLVNNFGLRASTLNAKTDH